MPALDSGVFLSSSFTPKTPCDFCTIEKRNSVLFWDVRPLPALLANSLLYKGLVASSRAPRWGDAKVIEEEGRRVCAVGQPPAGAVLAAAGARGSSCSRWANQEHLLMSADRALANRDAAGLCWPRQHSVCELTSSRGLPGTPHPSLRSLLAASAASLAVLCIIFWLFFPPSSLGDGRVFICWLLYYKAYKIVSGF